MKCKFCLYFHSAYIFVQLHMCIDIFIHTFLLLLYLVISIFISTDTCILFPVSPQCTHVTQKLTEPGSILGDICHQQCMTVEKSVKIYRALYWMVPIDLHLPDTVTDRANQPITALETHRHSFTGEMGWDEIDWLTDCHWATGALRNHLFTAGRVILCWCMSVYQCVPVDALARVSMYGWCLRVRVVILIQITHRTLSVVTGKESGCQVGPPHIFKDWQN